MKGPYSPCSHEGGNDRGEEDRERVERNGQWRGEGNKMGQRFGKGETDEGVMNHHVIRKIESLATGGSPRSFNKQTPFTQCS